MKITWLDALNYGINAIKKTPEYDSDDELKEAVKKLTNMKKRDYFVKWNKEKICNALDSWRDENGRPPTVTDLENPDLPSPIIIHSHFGVKASVFLKTRYPELRPKKPCVYGYTTDEEWIEVFREQFIKHNIQSSKEYNVKRDDKTPAWCTIAKHLNISRWYELMKLADVSYKVRSKPQPKEMTIRIHTKSEKKRDEYLKDCTKLVNELIEKIGYD